MNKIHNLCDVIYKQDKKNTLKLNSSVLHFDMLITHVLKNYYEKSHMFTCTMT